MFFNFTSQSSFLVVKCLYQVSLPLPHACHVLFIPASHDRFIKTLIPHISQEISDNSSELYNVFLSELSLCYLNCASLLVQFVFPQRLSYIWDNLLVVKDWELQLKTGLAALRLWVGHHHLWTSLWGRQLFSVQLLLSFTLSPLVAHLHLAVLILLF